MQQLSRHITHNFLFCFATALLVCVFSCTPQTEQRSFTAEYVEETNTLKKETEQRRKTLAWTDAMRHPEKSTTNGDSEQGDIKKTFFSDKSNFVVVPLEDPYGTTIYDANFEAIVVSEETEPTAIEINEIRVSKGMKPLDIVVVSFVLAYDGIPISSTRIRSGEINKNGDIVN